MIPKDHIQAVVGVLKANAKLQLDDLPRLFPWNLAIDFDSELDSLDAYDSAMRLVLQALRLPTIGPDMMGRVTEEKCLDSFIARLVKQFEAQMQWPLIHFCQALTSQIKYLTNETATIQTVRPFRKLLLNEQIHDGQFCYMDKELWTAIDSVECDDDAAICGHCGRCSKLFEKAARKAPIFDLYAARTLPALHDLCTTRSHQLPWFYSRDMVKAWFRLEVFFGYRLLLLRQNALVEKKIKDGQPSQRPEVLQWFPKVRDCVFRNMTTQLQGSITLDCA
jgi:hypothetical protein